ncbi:FHA domain-containing protein [candidate division NPL-UPA2 bacterium]|nr:FHA domain-containing protein [candidate division NPL-UPA2 bacterium]
MRLIQKKGSGEGKTYLLSSSGITSIGRLSSNTICLRGEDVSRQHCQIEGRDNIFTIKDLGSTNRTLVNGKIISEQVLKDGDVRGNGTHIVTPLAQ